MSGAELGVTIRPATGADADRLYEIHRAAMKEVVEKVYGPWRETDQRSRQDQWVEGGAVEVVEINGQTVGALKVTWEQDRLYVDRIELAPDWQGRGIGTAILTDLLTEADRRQLRAELDVFDVNPAVGLYQRLGFQSTSATGRKVHMVRRPAP